MDSRGGCSAVENSLPLSNVERYFTEEKPCAAPVNGAAAELREYPRPQATAPDLPPLSVSPSKRGFVGGSPPGQVACKGLAPSGVRASSPQAQDGSPFPGGEPPPSPPRPFGEACLPDERGLACQRRSGALVDRLQDQAFLTRFPHEGGVLIKSIPSAWAKSPGRTPPVSCSTRRAVLPTRVRPIIDILNARCQFALTIWLGAIPPPALPLHDQPAARSTDDPAESRQLGQTSFLFLHRRSARAGSRCHSNLLPLSPCLL